MKWLVILLFPSLCFAKEYQMYWNLDYKGEVNHLEYKIEAADMYEAIQRGALFCGKFFADRMPITEDSKWAIFDTCLNPRFK